MIYDSAGIEFLATSVLNSIYKNENLVTCCFQIWHILAAPYELDILNFFVHS